MNLLTTSIRGKGLLFFVSIAMTVVFVALRLWNPVALQTLRLKSFDFYQRAQPRQDFRQPVTIIDIDEESLAAYGQWPWPRTLVAELTTKLTNSGVAVIGYDIIFAEPDRTTPANIARVVPGFDKATRDFMFKMPSNDTVFAEALKATKAVLGQSTTLRPSDEMTDRETMRTSVGVTGVLGVDPLEYVFEYVGLIRNLQELEDAVLGIGLTTIQPEIDGVVRRVPMVARVGLKLYPTLAIEMLRVALGRQSVLVVGDALGVFGIKLTKNLIIPTDKNGRAWVNFSPHSLSRYVSAKDVLQGTLPEGRLAGHLVIIGTSSIGLRDSKTTPMDDLVPGVEIQAQLLETVLEDIERQKIRTAIAKLLGLPEAERDMVKIKQYRDQLDNREALGPVYLIWPNYAVYAELATLLAMCALMALMTMYVGAVWSLFAGGATVAVFLAGSWFLFVEEGILLDVAYASIAGFLIYSVLTYLNYVREEYERRSVRDAFSHYLSSDLIEQLAGHPEQLHLGGEMRVMTLLFCDVRGFTSISEQYKADPQGLTSLINRILTPTTEDILAQSGTIDKYIGDCIMAFWNAPLDDEDHAVHACKSALAILDSVATLNDELKIEAEDSGQPFIPINMGVGLNTGECCVGNMGSKHRFDYTVLGDAVNLASRLEGQSKNYGVDIVIGENTFQEARDFASIELDLIKVKGKDEAVRIHALLGDSRMRNDPKFTALTERHAAMLTAYRDQHWAEALGAIDDCRKLNGGLDKFYDVYEKRIRVYEFRSPGAGWDGVFADRRK